MAAECPQFPPIAVSHFRGPLQECVGEKAVKFGIRNRETRLREVPVSGAEGHLSRLFTRRQESRFCDLLAEKYSQGNAEAA
jgi:hypothetical protein